MVVKPYLSPTRLKSIKFLLYTMLGLEGTVYHYLRYIDVVESTEKLYLTIPLEPRDRLCYLERMEALSSGILFNNVHRDTQRKEGEE